MKLKSLTVLVTILALGTTAFARGAISDVGKAAKKTAHGTAKVAKKTAHGGEKAAKETGRGTAKVATKTADAVK